MAARQYPLFVFLNRTRIFPVHCTAIIPELILPMQKPMSRPLLNRAEEITTRHGPELISDLAIVAASAMSEYIKLSEQEIMSSTVNTEKIHAQIADQ